jgi:DNA-binding NtrC family response regulator
MMTKRCAVVFALLLLGNSSGVFLACGDKFLVPNRGSRSQRPSARSAAILIYDSGSDLKKGFAGDSAAEILRKAGFRPATAATSQEFEQQLAATRWDAVLTGIGTAPALSARLNGNPQAPVVIPVAFEATEAQLKEKRQQYSVVLRVPAKNKAFLSAIDKALDQSTKIAKSL